MSGANSTPLGNGLAGELPSAGAVKLSREEFKRQKVIEEQRKAGTIPAEVDPETGADINPHIPNYISQAPWYLDINHPTLKHQRGPEAHQDGINDWYQRGAKDTSVIAKKFRKGACENCGAMTHKTRDCLDRPRPSSKTAKAKGKTIGADEIVTNISLGFDAKRDRWNGYDPNQHTKIIKDWELVDQERKRLREEAAAKDLHAAANKSSPTGKEKEMFPTVVGEEEEKKQLLALLDEDEEVDGDEDKYADAADQIGQKLDTKSRTTVRNLRIREDTAKYLLNLDRNSAYYDPKTRSMRDNPNADKDPKDLQYAGDNFVRWTGDAPKMAQLQMFAWQSAGGAGGVQSSQLHLQANPTMGEILFKEHERKKESVAEVKKDSVLARYGGEEHLQAPPKELLLAQTEHYVEYSQTGKVIKGQERATVRSKYEEDVLNQNHRTVWGSYWNAGRWGYACCHSFTRSSYCTGQAGIEAAAASNKLLQERQANATGSSSSSGEPEGASKSLYETHLLKTAKELLQSGNSSGKDKKEKTGSGVRLGEGEVVIDNEKLKKALAKEEARKRSSGDGEDANGGKKRKKFNSVEESVDVTEEDLEAYRMSRAAFDDPMAKYKDEDD
ncbi:Pre-mRNA splicing Prp18-interacting factor-domain-containing protein [Obelidium mucronatum]|nr:Pre-mRNA splicing Prp18-interacting factor-domain-containing protein [Obelidium mucronatum]